MFISNIVKRAAALFAGATLTLTAMMAPSASAATPTVTAGTGDSIGILASSTCHVGSSGNCTTAIVAANASGHWIYISVNNRLRPSPCPFRVRDTVNGAVIHSGTVGTNSFYGRTLSNVYSQYQVELRGCSISAQGYITNT